MKKIAIFLLCTVLLLGGACRQEQKPAADSAGKNGIPAQSEYPAQNHAADTHAEKTIYLTFDDGPTDSTTPKILDILKNENVKATFFVIGRQMPSAYTRRHTNTKKYTIRKKLCSPISALAKHRSEKYSPILKQTSIDFPEARSA